MSAFMETYKEFISYYGGTSKAQSISKEKINEKYLGSGEYQVSHSPLWPGCFYMFNHSLKMDPMELQSKDLNYIDTQPIILSLGGDKNKKEIGLNLNIIPSKIKLTIIERLWKTYNSIIEQNAGQSFGKWKKISDLNINKIESISGGLNLDFAINKFKPSNIKKLKLIDYNDIVLFVHFYQKKIIFRNNYGYSKLFEDFIKKMKQ